MLVRQLQYPRVPGSNTQVLERDWLQEAPFGRCPACGSLAMEDLPNPREEIVNFYCSDITCRDDRGRRTMWGTAKSQALKDLERDGGSWNLQKFPGQRVPEACPD
jgi:hypothetical protein